MKREKQRVLTPVATEVTTSFADASNDVRFELERISDDGSALVGIQDPLGQFRYCNRMFREAFFIDAGETLTWEDMVRRNHYAKRGVILDIEDFEAWFTSVSSRRGKVKSRAFEAQLYDGRWIYSIVNTQENGWTHYIAFDVTALRGSERELRTARDQALAIAELDELTGVSNRRHIMALLKDTIAGDNATNVAGGCICLLDIDFFKRVNDELGHQAGDLVLRSFAQLTRRAIRLADGLGRVGGEEFLLVMPDTDIAEAKRIVDRIYDSLSDAVLLPDHPRRRITFSGGLTQLQRDDTPEDAYKRADDALYEAKGAGRYRLHVSG